jgi:hypothetical protein
MNPWNSIHQELDRLHEAEANKRTISHRHLRTVPVRDMSIQAVAEETRLRCLEYDPEIAASVASWQWGGSFSTISEPAQMWRYVRLNSASMWVAMVSDTPRCHLVFPPPRIPRDAVIRWLLTDWWNLHGIWMRALIERTQ